MDRLDEASEKEWQDCVDELATHYDKVSETNAREVLRSSRFGDHEDNGQVQAVMQQALRKSKKDAKTDEREA